MSTQYFTDSDANGRIIGFYNTDVWDAGKIPTSAIEITEEQWHDASANQGKYLIQNGTFVLAPAPTAAQQLASAQTAKIAELNTDCNTTILSGFSSSALGAPHNYDFDYDAQMNFSGMMNAVNANMAPASITWKTTDGNLSHTQAQFKQLFADGMNFKNNQITKYWTLKAQVNAATTTTEVQAIVW